MTLLGKLIHGLLNTCKNKEFFKSMRVVDDDTVVCMKNSPTIPIIGIGDVELVFTFRNVVTLSHIVYV